MFRFREGDLSRVSFRALLILGFVVLTVSGVAVARSHHVMTTKHAAPAVVEIAPIDPTCTSASPCIEYDNNGTGPGIRGISVDGNGLAGATKHISSSLATGREGLIGNDISSSGSFNAGVRGLSVRGTGVAGQSTSGPGVVGTASGGAGVVGTASGGAGVEGSSTSGTGVFGSSSSGVGSFSMSTSSIGAGGVSSSSVGAFGESGSSFGVLGETFNSSTTSGLAAVEGFDENGVSGDLNQGVLGFSSLSIGVEGRTSTGTAVDAVASGSGGTAINASATTGIGLLVVNGGSAEDAAFLTGSIGGDAFIGEGNGLGLMALGFATSPSTVPALNANCSSAPAITATQRGFGDIMSLDCSGNMILTGGLTTFGTPLVVKRNAAGTQVATFSARQTVPTLEDVGEAQLAGGQAYVRIAPDFAATIDRQANYLVFITPQGESRGLYVTQKTGAGFEVRENGGGRSSLAFDYRIVAKPYGESSLRLPTMRVNMRTDASMAAAMQRAVRAKAQVSADLARARDRALHARLQVQLIDRKVKVLKAHNARPR
jgi:hypothetical protein